MKLLRHPHRDLSATDSESVPPAPRLHPNGEIGGCDDDLRHLQMRTPDTVNEPAIELSLSPLLTRAAPRREEEDPTMIPDYLIIDEIRRKQEERWEPEPLHLPLYIPHWPGSNEDEEEEESEPSSRVIIIDM